MLPQRFYELVQIIFRASTHQLVSSSMLPEAAATMTVTIFYISLQSDEKPDPACADFL
jgi:hypothetical protein